MIAQVEGQEAAAVFALVERRVLPAHEVPLHAGRVTAGLVVGTEVDGFERDLLRIAADGRRVAGAGGLEEAVRLAFQEARPGDVVLLAPGCASFDMFENYEERGRVFKQIVASLPTGEGAAK